MLRIMMETVTQTVQMKARTNNLSPYMYHLSFSNYMDCFYTEDVCSDPSLAGQLLVRLAGPRDASEASWPARLL